MQEDSPGDGFRPPAWVAGDFDLWLVGWRWSGHVGEGMQHPRVRTAAVRRKAAEDVTADIAAMRAETEGEK